MTMTARRPMPRPATEQVDDLRFALAAVTYLKEKGLAEDEVVEALVEQLELGRDVARALVLTHRVQESVAA